MNKKKLYDSTIFIWTVATFYPIKESLKDKLKRFFRRFHRWYYINNPLPSKSDILTWIEANKIKPTDDQYVYHKGRVKLHYPIDLREGKAVSTKYGIGKIYKFYPDNHKINVDMYTINGKYKGYYKLLNVRDIAQLVVYHALTQQFVLVSPKDYVYILEDGQEIEYRITNRGFATLSDNYKYQMEHIKLFNEKRGGKSILKKLYKQGYIIAKIN